MLFVFISLNASCFVKSRGELTQLKTELPTKKGIDRIHALLELSEAYSMFNNDTCLIYASTARQLSANKNYDWGIHKSIYCSLLIESYTSSLNRYKAVYDFNIKWFKNNGFTEDAFLTRNLLIGILKYSDGTPNARLEALENLRIAQALENPELLGKAWFEIKNCKSNMIDDENYPFSLDSAQHYSREAMDSITIIRENLRSALPRNGWADSFEMYFACLKTARRWKNTVLIYEAEMYVSLGYAGKRKIDSAFKHLAIAEKLAPPIDNTLRLGNRYSRAGYIHSRGKNSIEHKNSIMLAIEIANELDSKADLAHHYQQLGWIFLDEGNYEESIAYTLLALDIAEQIKTEFQIYTCHHTLANLYRVTNEYDKALEIYKKIISWVEITLNGITKDRTLCNIYSEIGKLNYDFNKIDESVVYYENLRLRLKVNPTVTKQNITPT